MFRTHILRSHALVFLVTNISDVIGYFVSSIAFSATVFGSPGNGNPCNFNDGGLRLMTSPLEWQLCSKWNRGTFSFSFFIRFISTADSCLYAPVKERLPLQLNEEQSRGWQTEEFRTVQLRTEVHLDDIFKQSNLDYLNNTGIIDALLFYT